MFVTHVVVYTFASGEHCKTLPTYVRLTPDAGHMVASLAALDRNPTHRTVLDVIIRPPLPEQFIIRCITLLTCHAVVVLYVTRRAYVGEARWALEDSVPWRRAVDLGAIGDRAVMEFVGSAVHMCPECCINDGIELSCSKKLPCEAERDAFRTARVVTEAVKRERFVVDG